MRSVDDMSPSGQLAGRSLLVRQRRPIEGMPRPVCERCPSFLPPKTGMRKGWCLSVSTREGERPRKNSLIHLQFINESPWLLEESKHSTACLSACSAAYMHSSSPSLTSIRRHSALSPPTLHGWPHLRKRARVEKKGGRVLCRHKPLVSMAAWLFCPDYRSVWIVLQWWWWCGGAEGGGVSLLVCE